MRLAIHPLPPIGLDAAFETTFPRPRIALFKAMSGVLDSSQTRLSFFAEVFNHIVFPTFGIYAGGQRPTGVFLSCCFRHPRLRKSICLPIAHCLNWETLNLFPDASDTGHQFFYRCSVKSGWKNL